MTRDELLGILEEITQAQLNALRQLRHQGKPKAVPSVSDKKSNISIVEGILRSSARPLHIDEILAAARDRFGRELGRESLVSALTKKVLDRRTFARVGKSTFALLDESPADSDPASGFMPPPLD